LYRAPRFCSVRIAFCVLPVRSRFASASTFSRCRCVRLCRRSFLPHHPPLTVILRSASCGEGPLFDRSAGRAGRPCLCSGGLQAGGGFVSCASVFAAFDLRFASASAFSRCRCARLCRRSFLPHHPPLAVILSAAKDLSSIATPSAKPRHAPAGIWPRPSRDQKKSPQKRPSRALLG
jgi:hypothetical protein